MKKLLQHLALIAIVLAVFVGCSSPSSSSPTSEPTQSSTASEVSSEPTSVVPLDTLMVGTASMNGDFISGFGTNAYDQSIKILTGGHIETFTVQPQGDIVLNETTVKDLEVLEDQEGNKTYTFTLHDDLLWNNGEQITAEDFVASVMWFSSSEWTEAGASSVGNDILIGYEEYNSGATDLFAGVQLLSDLSFSITVAAENFPFYWESVNTMISPIYVPNYLPSCEITSTEEGTTLVFSEGDLLSNCIRIAETERYAPTVTCGPYKFISFENQTVTLEMNEYFKGDINGDKPTIKYIVQKVIPQDTDVQWVINGEIDLVEGVVQGEKIEAAKTSDTTDYQTYLRAGFGYLAMLCDVGVTSDVNVRWALASLIDRSAVVEYVLGGYGGTVDSEYGIGQWMYAERAADLQELLKPISFNIDTANDYLDNSEWLYEADGTTAFDRTKANAEGTYLRHNASGEVLTVNHLGINDNVLTDIIEIQYAATAPLAGMDFVLSKSDYSTVLKAFYNAYEIPEDERVYNTFNLATNFSAVFDRYYSWHSDFVGTQQNRGQLSDAELDDLIIAMRETDPEDTEGYLDAWVAYQVRWNELMPQVPLYSNEYYDIYHEYVDNLNTSVFAGYENVICQMSKSMK